MSPHIFDQVDEVLFVLSASRLVVHVVPTLEPDEPGEPLLPSGQRRKILTHLCEAFFDLGNQLFVVGSCFATGRRRPEIFEKALTTPRRFDEQHRLVELITDNVAELKLRPDVVLSVVAGKPDRQTASFELTVRLKPHEDVVAHDPVAVAVFDVRVLRSPLALHDGIQDPLAAVVVLWMVEIDDALAFHVRLPGQNENLHGLRRVVSDSRHGRGDNRKHEQEVSQLAHSGQSPANGVVSSISQQRGGLSMEDRNENLQLTAQADSMNPSRNSFPIFKRENKESWKTGRTANPDSCVPDFFINRCHRISRSRFSGSCFVTVP